MIAGRARYSAAVSGDRCLASGSDALTFRPVKSRYENDACRRRNRAHRRLALYSANRANLPMKKLEGISDFVAQAIKCSSISAFR